jgi:pantothenate kinase type III
MSDRLLIEIGNSTVKVATLDTDGVLRLERYSNLEALLRRIESSALPVLVAQTGSALGDEIIARLEDAADVSLVDRAAFQTLIGDSYDTPDTLGLDRILNIAGLESDAIVISCGTAITIDARVEGEPRWGAIMPGFTTAADGLHTRIPQLPLVSSRIPTMLPARDSITSVANGIVLGTAFGAKGIAASLVGNRRLRVVLTGGDAEVMQRFWEGAEVDDTLLFRGMSRVDAP